MERHGQAPFNPSIRGSVFTIQTQRRTYHLEADCEAEMEKWVDAICRVCGLRATLDVPAGASRHNNVIGMSFIICSTSHGCGVTLSIILDTIYCNAINKFLTNLPLFDIID